jgi:prevent-host-death family protein
MSSVSIADASRQLSQLVNRAAYGREVVIITSRGQAKAVLMGVEPFRKLVGSQKKAHLIPLDAFQKQFSDALVEAGYDTREKIVNLVREVKREIANERNISGEA